MHLGLDLGTSGLKGLLIDEDQNVVAESISGLAVSRPREGWSEQSPSDWIDAAKNVFNDLHRKSGLSSLKSIGLSGHMHGATLIDKHDRALRPCVLWNDTRSHAEAAEMDSDAEFRAVSGNIVFPGFTAPKLAWVRKNEPEIFDQTAKVLLPKDYLRLWLSGEYVSEMSDAAGTSWLDTGRRCWSGNLLAKTGLSPDQVPRLVEGKDVSGSLRSSLKTEYGIKQEVIVAGGGGDNAASAIGVGAVKSGDAFISLGTSGVMFVACDDYLPDAPKAVHTFCHALPDLWHQLGVVLSAADSLNWYCRLVGQDVRTLTGGLGTLRPPGKTLFLPYLGGERTPHNDAGVRGAFIGLEHATDPEAGCRAILEGVTHAFRDCFLALTSSGIEINRLMAVGGGSNSDYWLEALAASLDIPIDVPVAGNYGAALGAARLGMMAAGAGEDVAMRPSIDRTVSPTKEMHQAFSEAHSRFNDAYKSVKRFT